MKGNKTNNEEWIWVEGYKGTDKDMKCRDFKFTTNQQYDMPEGEKIEECKSGFHLCINLKDVFKHYPIGDGNRYFRVKALVRREDFNECFLSGLNGNGNSNIYIAPIKPLKDKLAAKSIVFLYELTTDEILQASGINVTEWTDELKALAIDTKPKKVEDVIKARKLVELGYCEPLAAYCVHEDKFEVACAVASQPDLSMDMRVFFIMNDKGRKDAWDQMIKAAAAYAPMLSASDLRRLFRCRKE